MTPAEIDGPPRSLRQATTRALSALVAAATDSVERRLDAVETGCELLVRRQRHDEPARQ
jgi:hypothetical protein